MVGRAHGGSEDQVQCSGIGRRLDQWPRRLPSEQQVHGMALRWRQQRVGQGQGGGVGDRHGVLCDRAKEHPMPVGIATDGKGTWWRAAGGDCLARNGCRARAVPRGWLAQGWKAHPIARHGSHRSPGAGERNHVRPGSRDTARARGFHRTCGRVSRRCMLALVSPVRFERTFPKAPGFEAGASADCAMERGKGNEWGARTESNRRRRDHTRSSAIELRAPRK